MLFSYFHGQQTIGNNKDAMRMQRYNAGRISG
jgi:hypothetical protein